MKKQFQVEATAPGRGTVWRPLGKHEDLGDLPQSSAGELMLAICEFGTVLGGGGVPASLRCAAIGLERGDCTQHHIAGSAYCYYHDKVQTGAIDGFQTNNSVGGWNDISPREIYPVWPLPKKGYVLLEREQLAA